MGQIAIPASSKGTIVSGTTTVAGATVQRKNSVTKTTTITVPSGSKFICCGITRHSTSGGNTNESSYTSTTCSGSISGTTLTISVTYKGEADWVGATVTRTFGAVTVAYAYQ